MNGNDPEHYLDQLIYDLLYNGIVSKEWIARSLEMSMIDFLDVFDEVIVQAHADSEQ